jgi:SAM-dependent methyltransferase
MREAIGRIFLFRFHASRPASFLLTMPSVPSAPEQRFSDRVENYVRHRPSYPGQILALLQREAGLRANSVIADVGSGTGISAKLLLRAGCKVFGVEPNREMRQAAERLLAGEPSFHSINGTAEATTLEDHSVDLVVAAQAFHWFKRPEARAEFSRILRSDGRVALIWNERQLDGTPFLRAYEQLLLTFATDYAQVRHENIGNQEFGEFFMDGAFTAHSMPNEQSFDYEGLKGRLLSSSYAPAEGRPDHEPMIEELARIFEQHQSGGLVCFKYDTRVYVGR